MTDIRKHIVDDLGQHISTQVIRAYQQHMIRLEASGATCAEGMAISGIVAAQFVIASIGGAALLSDKEDPGALFDIILAALVADIMARKSVIAANLEETRQASR